MSSILPLLVIVPVLVAMGTLLIKEKYEKAISWLTISATTVHLLLSLCIIAFWITNNFTPLSIKEFVVYKMPGYEFYIDLYFDKITAVFLFLGSILSFLISIYSSYYMHNERGYRRFFSTVLLFFGGYNLVIISGNFETLFLGWEVLGLSSFLLIAFYRNRFLPVKNAVKVFSVYRLGDVGILLAMWLSHHLWHANVTFSTMSNIDLVQTQMMHHRALAIAISLALMFTATIKSAQFPFSSWIARAMEGPTPSSAIFYGSLAIHIGAFLLLRTLNFWNAIVWFKVLIILCGLFSFLVSTFIARVQSSIKAQIAFSSSAQIGLIFVEIGFGFETLALIHIVGNAFLRTHQLLISPSSVAYKMREQFFNFKPKKEDKKKWFGSKLQMTIYNLSLNEWHLDDFLFRTLWMPLKKIGSNLNFINTSNLLIFIGPLFAVGSIALFYKDRIPTELSQYLPELMALIGLILVIKAFTERKSPNLALSLVILNHCWVALAVSFNEAVNWEHVSIYLGGVLIFGVIAYTALFILKRHENHVFLNRFNGHVNHHKTLATVFLIGSIGVAGFPISPTFIGEDLIFSHIHSEQLFLAVFASLSFIIDGLALIRIYARVFLGPSTKPGIETAYRSA
ncbi:MAG: hypothetical protein H6607_13455 [Flavobacteriales bacterium]|nr:hypothetical protein [Flavobacteriales bacterium]